MTLLRKPYLLSPVLFILVLFLLDKLLLLPEVRQNFIQGSGMIYYEQRKQMLTDLKKTLSNTEKQKRSVVVLGDSRSLALGELTLSGSEALQKKYGNYTIYNFSAPQALPAWYAWLAEKIFQGRHRPAYVLVGISPEAFNRRAGLMSRPIMQYGLDDSFVRRYQSVIAQADLDFWQGTRRFAISGYGFSFRILRNRWAGGFKDQNQKRIRDLFASMQKHSSQGAMNIQAGSGIEAVFFFRQLAEALKPNMYHYSLKRSPWRQTMDLTRGAYYGWLEIATPDELRQETERLQQVYLNQFAITYEQFFFLQRTLKLARLAGTRAVVYWPRVNPYMRELYPDYPQLQSIWREVQRIAAENGAEAMNLNREGAMQCDKFYDASHMSAICFPEMQLILMDHLHKPFDESRAH